MLVNGHCLTGQCCNTENFALVKWNILKYFAIISGRDKKQSSNFRMAVHNVSVHIFYVFHSIIFCQKDVNSEYKNSQNEFFLSVRCSQKTVKRAYCIVCQACCQRDAVCAKCGQHEDIVAKWVEI